ncbi:glycoprotein integral membrane protein 1 isoform X1 [Acipenser oxyrinchus oxyrinchus]|uniref:Glycoprotein integral membrane protein 1 isoform X1 n=1 Tax=Acipenser oxyrinchus oxyrinchus TaxID=40147 RepID=A0AAD8GC35_ACIOX|nr:glycoprotein integral membrane protein 1 isoform X1 [Acipenser oxyrinchus oxyrinchus]
MGKGLMWLYLTAYLVFFLLIFKDAAAIELDRESIMINVTTVGETDEAKVVQINFNISAVDDQIYVNNIPVKLSGVTRLNCRAQLLEGGNLSKAEEPGRFVMVSVRVLVRQWPLESEPVVHLLAFNEEVTEVEGKQVQQAEMYEVNIFMNKEFQKLRQSSYSYPMKESILNSIPRDSDILFTVPNLPEKVGDQSPAQTMTTSHYPFKQAETTVEEKATPGKLPETPLRMTPDFLYDEETADEYGPAGKLPVIPLRSQPLSSYNEMCRWVEQLRERLRRFWTESLPLFFLFMWVVVVGVVGSAVIVKVLDLLFPTYEDKGDLKLDPVTMVPLELPVEGKLLLLDHLEMETDEEVTSP